MKKHGVRTIYLETGNSRSKGDVFKSTQAQQFITAAHANDMKIVAWYLPDLKDLPRDYARIEKAIQLTTPGGERFDSFALDIESGAVKTVSKRNAALLKLSRQIRDSVGPTYPLGAITPSPVGLAKKGSYWGSFPYTELAGIYDVMVPMSYYTYHGDGAKVVRADTLGNMRILRAQKGCETIPVHLIGGVAEDSSAAELAAFVQAAHETGAIGVSFYSWSGTKAAHWAELASRHVRHEVGSSAVRRSRSVAARLPATSEPRAAVWRPSEYSLSVLVETCLLVRGVRARDRGRNHLGRCGQRDLEGVLVAASHPEQHGCGHHRADERHGHDGPDAGLELVDDAPRDHCDRSQHQQCRCGTLEVPAHDQRHGDRHQREERAEQGVGHAALAEDVHAGKDGDRPEHATADDERTGDPALQRDALERNACRSHSTVKCALLARLGQVVGHKTDDRRNADDDGSCAQESPDDEYGH